MIRITQIIVEIPEVLAIYINDVISLQQLCKEHLQTRSSLNEKLLLKTEQPTTEILLLVACCWLILEYFSIHDS